MTLNQQRISMYHVSNPAFSLILESTRDSNCGTINVLVWMSSIIADSRDSYQQHERSNKPIMGVVQTRETWGHRLTIRDFLKYNLGLLAHYQSRHERCRRRAWYNNFIFLNLICLSKMVLTMMLVTVKWQCLQENVSRYWRSDEESTVNSSYKHGASL